MNCKYCNIMKGNSKIKSAAKAILIMLVCSVVAISIADAWLINY